MYNLTIGTYVYYGGCKDIWSIFKAISELSYEQRNYDVYNIPPELVICYSLLKVM